MKEFKRLINQIFNINTQRDFENTALEIFRLQAENNPTYKKYISHLGLDPGHIKAIEQIPYLPVDFFKTHKIFTGNHPVEKEFMSSSTTGQIPSIHYIYDLSLYEKSFCNCFHHFYGDITDYCFLALLPSYLERDGSSLVYMAERLIKMTKHNQSGFYLDNHEKLAKVILRIEKQKQKTILLGVSFAFMQFAEKNLLCFEHTLVMETGGMKGRQAELTREELHGFLKQRLGVNAIHSEYGMTELLSQAYSKEDGKFFCPPWMKILIRDTNDPFSYMEPGKSGGINIIDLANIYSCSFIESKDIGKIKANGSFEVLGRFDNSDIRGCNLMIG
ncbi:MAG: acyl transferase [Bacteroidia bacterium]|nr:acyl transferase [Bacteroidia bacterium]